MRRIMVLEGEGYTFEKGISSRWVTVIKTEYGMEIDSFELSEDKDPTDWNVFEEACSAYRE